MAAEGGKVGTIGGAQLCPGILASALLLGGSANTSFNLK